MRICEKYEYVRNKKVNTLLGIGTPKYKFTVSSAIMMYPLSHHLSIQWSVWKLHENCTSIEKTDISWFIYLRSFVSNICGLVIQITAVITNYMGSENFRANDGQLCRFRNCHEIDNIITFDKAGGISKKSSA